MSHDHGIMVHVIGLQRSGTNFINRLLDLNTTASVVPSGDRSVCWKHSLPWEHSRHTGFSAVEAIRRQANLRVLVVSKDPFTWWESISKRGPQDFFQKRPGCKFPDGNADISNCLVLYNSYYGAWLKFVDDDQIRHIRYEDALIDPSKFVQQIACDLGLQAKGEIKAPRWVPYSRKFTPERRAYYIEGATDLSEPERAAIVKLIDFNLLSSMGYRAGALQKGNDLPATDSIRRKVSKRDKVKEAPVRSYKAQKRRLRHEKGAPERLRA